MRPQSIGLGASLALAANAILLPPSISSVSTEPGNTVLIHPNRQIFQVECKACPFGEVDQERGVLWTEGTANSLVFEIDTGAHKDALNINGAQMFPPTLSLIPEAIYVHQVPAGVEVEAFLEHNPRLRVTGYEFRFDAGEIITEDGNELLPMTFTVHSIAGLSVPKQTLRIFVIKDINGSLGVAHVNHVQDSEERASTPDQTAADCRKWPMLCRLREIVSSKIHGMKNSFRKGGCRKMNDFSGVHSHTAHHGHLHGGSSHMTPHDTHHRHHHQHHRHGRFHRFVHVIGHVALSIIVPVLVGIAAGVVTYLVGMILGATIALVWIRIRARRNRYQPVALDEEEASDGSSTYDGADYKEAYLKEAYLVGETAEVEGEAPPAYTDLNDKEVVDLQKLCD